MSTRWITIIAFGTLSCSSPPGSRSDDGMVGGSTSGDEEASTTLSVEATAGTSGADGTSSGSGSTPPGSTSGDDGTSSTGTTTEPEGTTGAVEPCPPFDPPGPLAMKFDVATFQC